MDYDNTKVELKWVPPDNDGGRPILHYIIEMKDKFSVAWTQVLKTEDNKCRGTVEGLKENSVVQFRVRAVNKAGIGEPSDPTANHTVKHRHCKYIFLHILKLNFQIYLKLVAEMNILQNYLHNSLLVIQKSKFLHFSSQFKVFSGKFQFTVSINLSKHFPRA